MLVSLTQIGKSYGASVILEDITAIIEPGDRIGLVGVNGAGKSTLLNIICGELDADSGSVSHASLSNLGFLRQDGGLDGENTIMEEMSLVFAPLAGMEREMRELERLIGAASGADYDRLAARYAKLQERFEHREGYLTEVKINTVLNGMGFAGVSRDTRVSVLSGGEKTRLAICKLLLDSPDLLVLDEPTNHLDFKTLSWLEEYLRGYKGAILTVSHDRYFLDRLCGHIWELERHKLTVYRGDYSRYVEQKEERLERLRKEYDAQQSEIADIKDFISRNLVRASTTARAQSRRKTLEKMELVEKPSPPPRPAKIRFSYRREPVKDVLHVEDLAISVGDGSARKQLFKCVSLDMTRGDKVALIGANGIGKSSFLKSIQGMFPHDAGIIEWGKNTDVSYFEQEDFAMDPSKSALDELWDRFPREYEHRIRTVLGNVGLTGENVEKKVGELSGGERAKLKFAVLTLNCGNVLLMDEPTNHLDLPSREALDAALKSYGGTLLVVSHDRYLLNKVPARIAEMCPDGLRLYEGGYDAYLLKKAAEAAGPSHEREKTSREKPQNEYHRGKRQRSEEQARKRRLSELEKTIEELELAIFRLENEISSPEFAADYLKLQEKCDILEEKRQELDMSMSEWARLG